MSEVEVVEGRAPGKAALVGLRVTKSTVSETADGGARAVVTVAGTKLIRQQLVGEQVNVMTAGGQAGFGQCIEVTTKCGKQDGEKIYRMKIEGARQLDELVGLQVKVDQPQAELPLSVKEAKAGDACSVCGHPWSQDKNPRRAKDGHGKKAGTCYIDGCKCDGFIPTVV